MPKGKTLKMPALSVAKIQEITTEKSDGEDVKYKMYLESEAQGVKAVITRGEAFEGFVVGARVDVAVKNPQTTLDEG